MQHGCGMSERGHRWQSRVGHRATWPAIASILGPATKEIPGTRFRWPHHFRIGIGEEHSPPTASLAGVSVGLEFAAARPTVRFDGGRSTLSSPDGAVVSSSRQDNHA